MWKVSESGDDSIFAYFRLIISEYQSNFKLPNNIKYHSQTPLDKSTANQIWRESNS